MSLEHLQETEYRADHHRPGARGDALARGLGLGQQLQVHVAPMPQPAEATIVRYRPPFKVQWLDHVPGRVMSPQFAAKLEPLGPSRTRFVVQESFEGKLVGIAGRRLDRTMPAHYQAMCRALKKRVEER